MSLQNVPSSSEAANFPVLQPTDITDINLTGFSLAERCSCGMEDQQKQVIANKVNEWFKTFQPSDRFIALLKQGETFRFEVRTKGIRVELIRDKGNEGMANCGDWEFAKKFIEDVQAVQCRCFKEDKKEVEGKGLHTEKKLSNSSNEASSVPLPNRPISSSLSSVENQLNKTPRHFGKPTLTTPTCSKKESPTIEEALKVDLKEKSSDAESSDEVEPRSSSVTSNKNNKVDSNTVLVFEVSVRSNAPGTQPQSEVESMKKTPKKENFFTKLFRKKPVKQETPAERESSGHGTGGVVADLIQKEPRGKSHSKQEDSVSNATPFEGVLENPESQGENATFAEDPTLQPTTGVKKNLAELLNVKPGIPSDVLVDQEEDDTF